MESEPDFAAFTARIVGLPVSEVWRGYGSAIFLEIGELQPGRPRTDGSMRNPIGEWTVAIEWSWRIEGSIWCGSWSGEKLWPKVFARIKATAVVSVAQYGRLPELSLGFSNGLHLLSMMTADGDPAWWITKRADGVSTSISVRAGRFRIESFPTLS